MLWQWAVLTPQEILAVRYIRYDYWTALSAGTRSPVIAAERIQRGIEVYGTSNQTFLRLASLIARGVTMPPLILVSVPDPIAFVVLEGHTRLTAYVLAADALTAEIPVMIGIAPAMARWDDYRSELLRRTMTGATLEIPRKFPPRAPERPRRGLSLRAQ